MDFTRPQGYVDALKELEGSPLIGVEIKDGHVALPMDRRKGYGYGIVDYGLNKLDHFKQVMLFDEDSNVIAHVTIKNLTRKDWLHGKNLHSSMNVNQYKKYALLAKGVVFTAEADGLTGVFVNWLAMDSPVEHILDQGGRDIHRNRSGSCCRAAFQRLGRDEKLLQHVFRPFDPLVREGWTVDRKPVVMFRLDQGTLKRKELLFNVIR